MLLFTISTTISGLTTNSTASGYLALEKKKNPTSMFRFGVCISKHKFGVFSSGFESHCISGIRAAFTGLSRPQPGTCLELEFRLILLCWSAPVPPSIQRGRARQEKKMMWCCEQRGLGMSTRIEQNQIDVSFGLGKPFLSLRSHLASSLFHVLFLTVFSPLSPLFHSIMKRQ